MYSKEILRFYSIKDDELKQLKAPASSISVGIAEYDSVHLIEIVKHGLEIEWLEENPDGDLVVIPREDLNWLVDEIMSANNYNNGHSGVSRYGEWITVY